MMATEEGNFGNYVSSLPEVQEAIEYINSIPEYASIYNSTDDDVNTIASGENADISTVKPSGMYLGGLMTPRLNTGGTIEETVVTAPREDSPNFNVRDSLVNPLVRGSAIPYQDGTLDPDIRGSAMMEDDEGYDEAYSSGKRMTVQEMFGDEPEKKSLNSLNVAAIENFKKDLPAAIEAASVKGTVADNPRNIGESIFQSLAQSLVEGDDWLFGGKDTKAFQNYKKAMGVNSNYVFNVPAGLGKN